MNHATTAYAFAAVPTRFALERRAWEEASRIEARVPATIPWDQYPFFEAMAVFGRGLGAVHTGDAEGARSAASRLAELEAASRASPIAYDWATQVRVQELGLRAWIEYTAGRIDEGLAQMVEAAELEATTEKNPVTPGEVLPAGELLGDMLLHAGRPVDALDAYLTALERTPRRFNSVRGAARAAGGSRERRLGPSAIPDAPRARRRLGHEAGVAG